MADFLICDLLIYHIHSICICVLFETFNLNFFIFFVAILYSISSITIHIYIYKTKLHQQNDQMEHLRLNVTFPLNV